MTSRALPRPCIACIVEGHGDAEAVKILICRIAATLQLPIVPQIAQPIVYPRGKLINRPTELAKAVQAAALRTNGRGGIFILIDSEGDCPVNVGQVIRNGALHACGALPVAVALAHRQFETWFLAAAVSLAGKHGLAKNLAPPAHPERIPDPKRWLSTNMAKKRRAYSETVDQPKLARDFDMTAAQSTRSFRKCYKEIESLLVHVQTTPLQTTP